MCNLVVNLHTRPVFIKGFFASKMAVFSVFSFALFAGILHCVGSIHRLSVSECIKYDPGVGPLANLSATYLQKRNERIRLMVDGKPFDTNFSLTTYAAMLFRMKHKFYTLRFSDSKVYYKCEFQLVQTPSSIAKNACDDVITLPNNDFCVPSADDPFSCHDERGLRHRLRFDGHRFFDIDSCQYINEGNYSTTCSDEWAKMDPLGKAWVYDPVINRTFLVSDPGRNAEFLSPQFSVACNIFAQSNSSFASDNGPAKVLVWYAPDIQNGSDFIKLDPKKATCLLVDGFDFQMWHTKLANRDGKCRRMFSKKAVLRMGRNETELRKTENAEDDFFLFAILLSPFMALGFFLFAVLLNMRYLKTNKRQKSPDRQDTKAQQQVPVFKPQLTETQTPPAKNKGKVVEKKP